MERSGGGGGDEEERGDCVSCVLHFISLIFLAHFWFESMSDADILSLFLFAFFRGEVHFMT